ncbi:MAG: hypothetical protein KA885_07100 [Spirochaetes bacterium]|nr:hypothetical protein [Spirochaetota bacterium]
MKKALKLLATVAVLTVLLIPTGCIMLVGGGGDTYYGFGWTASLDSFESSAAPDSIKMKNTVGEELKVKYKIFFNNELDGYDKEVEPDWDTINNSVTLSAVSGLFNVATNIFASYDVTADINAVVWLRVQNLDNSKYLAFSVQLANLSETEWNITISNENKY